MGTDRRTDGYDGGTEGTDEPKGHGGKRTGRTEGTDGTGGRDVVFGEWCACAILEFRRFAPARAGGRVFNAPRHAADLRPNLDMRFL